MMAMFDIFRSITFMVVLCGFWCCGVKGAQTSWDYVQGGTLTSFFEENLVAEGVSFLRSLEGCERAFTHTQKTVDEALTVRAIEEELRGPAEEKFNADSVFISGWCTRFQDVLDWADNVVSNMNDEERVLVRILCYLRIIENDKSLFLEQTKPNKLYIEMACALDFFINGPVYKCFVKKEGKVNFGLLQGLVAMAQDQALFVFRKYWGDSERVLVHGVTSDCSNHFLHDQIHAQKQTEMMVALNSFKDDLYQDFTKALIRTIKKDWMAKGLEYILSSFSILHERDLADILGKKGVDLQEKIKLCLKRELFDPGMYSLVEGLLPKGYFIDTITQKEKENELKRVLMQWEVEILAKTAFCWRGADAVVRAREVRKTLQRSWRLQSVPEQYVSKCLVKELVTSLLKKEYHQMGDIRRKIVECIAQTSFMGKEPHCILVKEPCYSMCYGAKRHIPLATKKDLLVWSSYERRFFLKGFLQYFAQWFMEERQRLIANRLLDALHM